jgi:hypothetical protein
MSETESTGNGLEINPDDVSISHEGKVEIINPKLAEAIKTAVKERAQSRRLMEDSNTYACGANLYQCGKVRAAETVTPARITLK